MKSLFLDGRIRGVLLLLNAGLFLLWLLSLPLALNQDLRDLLVMLGFLVAFAPPRNPAAKSLFGRLLLLQLVLLLVWLLSLLSSLPYGTRIPLPLAVMAVRVVWGFILIGSKTPKTGEHQESNSTRWAK